MKYSVIIALLMTALFSSENDIKENTKENFEKIEKEQYSQKEKKYQEYLKKIEIENQKLEDDGFCSCNNN